MQLNWDELTAEQVEQLNQAARETCEFEITAQSGRSFTLEVAK